MRSKLSGVLSRLRPLSSATRPRISVIVAVHNMEREAPRTLHSLSATYQQGMNESDYEVIVADCGSDRPLDEMMVKSHGRNFRLLRFDAAPSPVKSVNQAVRMSKGDIIMICIDGARILSPGILSLTLSAFRAFRDPLVATLAFHLGPGLQNESMLEGYDRNEEDRLLGSIDWMKNGYDLFSISSLAGSSRNGWMLPLMESNCLAMRRETFEKIGGLEEKFRMPGGGLVNLDFYSNACEATDELVLLLGEGSFHQIHGGVATNATPENHPFQEFEKEYIAIRGKKISPTEKKAILFGHPNPPSMRFLGESVKSWQEAMALK